MSFLNPPEWAHSGNSRKRRAYFDSDDDDSRYDDSNNAATNDPQTLGASQHFSHSINPLSHSEDTLMQMKTAGLIETAPLPSKKYPGFPHRGIPKPQRQRSKTGGGSGGDMMDIDYSGDDTEALDAVEFSGNGTEDDAAARGRLRAQQQRRGRSRSRSQSRSRSRSRSRVRSRTQGAGASGSTAAAESTSGAPESEARRYLDTMLDAIDILLDRGDIARAGRIYAAVLRLPELEGTDSKIDMRKNNLWAIGAELLMRAGETPDDNGSEQRRRRWGRASNMPRVREFFQQLILQYPWKVNVTVVMTAREFWLALLSCEVYNSYIEVQLREEDAEAKAAGWAEGRSGEEEEEDGEEGDKEKESKEEWLAREKERIRVAAYAEIRKVLDPLHELIERLPYSRDSKIIRMYAMILLLAADLAMPRKKERSNRDAWREGRADRKEYRRKAREALMKAQGRKVPIEEKLKEVLRLGEYADSEAEESDLSVEGEGEEEEEGEDGEGEDEAEERESEEEYGEEDIQNHGQSPREGSMNLPVRSRETTSDTSADS